MANTKIDNLANEIMEGLKEYADLASDDVKKAVRKAGTAVRKEIAANAPQDTGKYAKSWTVKKTKETSNSLEVIVHSKNRYQLAHLLEHGHAKRGGGRVAARPHIAQAEQSAVETLESEIERSLGGQLMDKILEMLKEMDIPFAYDHFAEGESPEPPFICYLIPGSDNFSADGRVYQKINEIHIELYTDFKDLSVESKVESVLDKYGIFYDYTETWIESEKMYEVLYSFEMEA